ncbi:hypothetical protein DMA11_17935 [Marinilabiliaceae bacterium JC017]|nr:hypothetical protein DMA11_17935 [Marinilabiliaceae bacterium JC017]
MRNRLRSFLKKLGVYHSLLSIYFAWIKMWQLLDIYILSPLLVHSSMFRKTYFLLFNRSFASEMKMYAFSRYQYMKKKMQGEYNEFLLRRNIHRIEKGLITPNRKAVFAKGYILETVGQFKILAGSSQDTTLTEWAYDILNEYFQIVQKEDDIIKGFELFKQIAYTPQTPAQHTPTRGEKLSNTLEGSFSTLALQRKSVRDFRNDIIPDRSNIDEAIILAATAPSSCNRQPFEFRIIDDTHLVQKLSVLPAGSKTFANNIPCLAIVIGKMDVSPSSGDRHLMYIDGSLAAMNFMLALQSKGIASCPINWPDNKTNETTLSKLIHIGKNERALLFIAFGFAKEGYNVACSARKGLNELRKYNY